MESDNEILREYCQGRQLLRRLGDSALSLDRGGQPSIQEPALSQFLGRVLEIGRSLSSSGQGSVSRLRSEEQGMIGLGRHAMPPVLLLGHGYVFALTDS